jgi:hypothetical protein
MTLTKQIQSVRPPIRPDDTAKAANGTREAYIDEGPDEIEDDIEN